MITAQADLRMLQSRYLDYGLQLELKTWHVDVTHSVKGIADKARRVYAAVSVEREVHNSLALVYLRIMRELGARHGVPFDPIDDSNGRLALPLSLLSIHNKLMAYALGQTRNHGLTLVEETTLYKHYVHLSANWNPATHDNAERDVLFINRPNNNNLRKVHRNE